MKTQLRAGAEIDLLTADELKQLLDAYLSGFLRPPQTVRPAQSIPLDASGNTNQNANSRIYEVPAGYVFRLHRAEFGIDGYTYGAPYTSNTGYLEIHQNGIARDGLPLTAPGLPAVWSGGTADGIEYRNGERVAVKLVGGPASKALNVQLQGTLEPIVSQ